MTPPPVERLQGARNVQYAGVENEMPGMGGVEFQGTRASRYITIL
jgi:hypothetical protein